MPSPTIQIPVLFAYMIYTCFGAQLNWILMLPPNWTSARLHMSHLNSPTTTKKRYAVSWLALADQATHSGRPSYHPMHVTSSPFNSIKPHWPLLYTVISIMATSLLTSHLCAAATALGTIWGLSAANISIRPPHSSGTMALLCAAVDPNKIHLLGRWRSDELLRYLHVQAFPIVHHLPFKWSNMAMSPYYLTTNFP